MLTFLGESLPTLQIPGLIYETERYTTLGKRCISSDEQDSSNGKGTSKFRFSQHSLLRHLGLRIIQVKVQMVVPRLKSVDSVRVLILGFLGSERSHSSQAF